ncbi:MAG TPA: hypothetical protein VEC12_12355 [Bacteroidia bacterium]|nr:hypothetical protein [Bacteroidia bacterium]
MQGVHFVTDSNNKKIAIQIDLKTLERYEQEIEDLLDTIIAESKDDEDSIPFDEVLNDLKKDGKL